MSVDKIVVSAIVLGAIAYLLRAVIRMRRAARASGPGCENCGH